MKIVREIKVAVQHTLSVMMLALLLLAAIGSAGGFNASAADSNSPSEIAVGDHLYMGNMDSVNYKGLPYWRVIDKDSEGNLFLLSEYLWKETGGIDNGLINYNPDTGYRFWPGSHAQDWCQTFNDRILSGHSEFAVKETTKSDATYVSPDYGNIQFLEYENILNKDKVFLLSAEEAAHYLPEKSDRIAYLHDGISKGKAESWWLRSARDYPGAICTGKIVSNGEIDRDFVNHLAAVRPAFWCSVLGNAAEKVTNADGNVWFLGEDADNFAEPEYVWSDDNTSCTAGTTHNKYNEHITETVATVSTVVKEATETQEGLVVYTATFSNARFGKQTKEVVIPRNAAAIRNGSKRSVGGSKFRVLSTGSRTVSLIKARNVKSYAVPSTVKLAGKSYKVTKVEGKSLRGSKIRTVTVGKNVNTLKKYAFSKSKATNVVLKTKLLKKSTVKGCLRGSRVKTIRVSVGSKSASKKMAKTYKRIFTRSNAGRKVTVN